MIDSKSVCCEAVVKARAGEGGRGRDLETVTARKAMASSSILASVARWRMSTTALSVRLHAVNAPISLHRCSTDAAPMQVSSSMQHRSFVRTMCGNGSEVGLLVCWCRRWGWMLTNGQAVKDHAELTQSVLHLSNHEMAPTRMI